MADASGFDVDAFHGSLSQAVARGQLYQSPAPVKSKAKAKAAPAPAPNSAPAGDGKKKRMQPTSIRVDYKPDTSKLPTAFHRKKLPSETVIALPKGTGHSPTRFGPDSAGGSRSGGSPRHRHTQSHSNLSSQQLAAMAAAEQASPRVGQQQHSARHRPSAGAAAAATGPDDHSTPLRPALKSSASAAALRGDLRLDSRSPAEFITQPPLSARDHHQQHQYQQHHQQHQPPRVFVPGSGDAEPSFASADGTAAGAAAPATGTSGGSRGSARHVAFGGVSERLFTPTFSSRRKGADPDAVRAEAESAELEKRKQRLQREMERMQQQSDEKLRKQELQRQRAAERQERRERLRHEQLNRAQRAAGLTVTAYVPSASASSASASTQHQPVGSPGGRRAPVPLTEQERLEAEAEEANRAAIAATAAAQAATAAALLGSPVHAPPPPPDVNMNEQQSVDPRSALSRTNFELALGAAGVRSQLSPRSRLLLPTQATALKFRAGARIGGFTTGGPARTAIGVALMRRGRSVDQLEILDPTAMLAPVAPLPKPDTPVRHQPASVGSSPFDARLTAMTEATKELSVFHREKIHAFCIPKRTTTTGVLPLFDSIVAGNTIHHPPPPQPQQHNAHLHHQHSPPAAQRQLSLYDAPALPARDHLNDSSSEDETFEDYQKKLHAQSASMSGIALGGAGAGGGLTNRRPSSPGPRMSVIDTAYRAHITPDVDHPHAHDEEKGDGAGAGTGLGAGAGAGGAVDALDSDMPLPANTPGAPLASFSSHFARSFSLSAGGAVSGSVSGAANTGLSSWTTDPKKAALEARVPGMLWKGLRPKAPSRPSSPGPGAGENGRDAAAAGDDAAAKDAAKDYRSPIERRAPHNTGPDPDHQYSRTFVSPNKTAADRERHMSSLAQPKHLTSPAKRAQSAAAARPSGSSAVSQTPQHPTVTSQGLASVGRSKKARPSSAVGFGGSAPRLNGSASAANLRAPARRADDDEDNAILRAEFTKELWAEMAREDAKAAADAAAAGRADADAQARANAWHDFFDSPRLGASLRVTSTAGAGASAGAIKPTASPAPAPANGVSA